MSYKVLLLSAYDATSHRRWRERLQALFPEYHWVQLTLPPRNFNWRIRGNSLQWAFNERDLLQQNYDLLIATSMVDLSSLRGFVPSLCQIPTVVYFHENQFVYPSGQQKKDNVEPLLVPIYTALCADKIVFNSRYNRSTFIEGAMSLLQKLPDQLSTEITKKLNEGEVIPVPVEAAAEIDKQAINDPSFLEIVWNHRWEYDKGIDLLLEFIRLVHAGGLPLLIHLVGEQFRQRPAQFEEIEQLLVDHARQSGQQPGEFGFIPQQTDYFRLLQHCDVVLSTSLHEFQGLAVQEAAVAGCTPLTPDDLVYPEYLEPEFLYRRNNNHAATAAGIVKRLQQWQELKQTGGKLPRVALQRYSMKSVGSEYTRLFQEIDKSA